MTFNEIVKDLELLEGMDRFEYLFSIAKHNTGIDDANRTKTNQIFGDPSPCQVQGMKKNFTSLWFIWGLGCNFSPEPLKVSHFMELGDLHQFHKLGGTP